MFSTQERSEESAPKNRGLELDNLGNLTRITLISASINIQYITTAQHSAQCTLNMALNINISFSVSNRKLKQKMYAFQKYL